MVTAVRILALPNSHTLIKGKHKGSTAQTGITQAIWAASELDTSHYCMKRQRMQSSKSMVAVAGSFRENQSLIHIARQPEPTTKHQTVMLCYFDNAKATHYCRVVLTAFLTHPASKLTSCTRKRGLFTIPQQAVCWF